MRFQPRKLLIASGVAAIGCGAPRVIEPYVPPPAVIATNPTCFEQWVELPWYVDFARGSAQLDDRARQTITEIFTVLRQRNDIRRIRVAGHTEACGEERDNVQLAHARATVVVQALIAQGVPSEHIEGTGFQSSTPCDDAESDANERRASLGLIVCREGYLRPADPPSKQP